MSPKASLENNLLKVCRIALYEIRFPLGERKEHYQGDLREKSFAKLKNSLQTLVQGEYKEDQLNRAVHKLVEIMKNDILGILQDEANLSAEEKKGNKLIGQLNPYLENLEKGELNTMTLGTLSSLLMELENLLVKEIDIKKARAALADHVRKLASKLRRE